MHLKKFRTYYLPALFSLSVFFSGTAPLNAQNNDILIRFDQPAIKFTSASPIGNGRLGALIFGGTDSERIALNEITLWSGGPQTGDRTDAFAYLQPIQAFLIKGDNEKAQKLLQAHFTSDKGGGSVFGHGAKGKYGSYQTAGDLLIHWKKPSGQTQGYYRELNLGNALSTVSYLRGNDSIKEEVFADFNQDVTRIRISSNHKNALNFKIQLSRKENANPIVIHENWITLQGQLPDADAKGMRYVNMAKVTISNGKLQKLEDGILVSNAGECDIILDTRTNYNCKNGQLENIDILSLAKRNITNASSNGFQKALNNSTQKYQSFFNRCRWWMPDTKSSERDLAAMTTERRLIHFYKGGSDPQLPILYFNFGRYLLISSSRPGLLPANLQGLWATEYQAPWNADYHLNINIQMNYWLSETTNLSDLAQPLFQFIKNLVPNGEKTAWNYYHAKGWVAHVLANPWFFTSPGEGAFWGSTITGGAWLCDHLWQHYLFTKDKNFLKTYYPVIKGSARFLESILIKEPTHGWLVTAPSNSPENEYQMPNGFKGQTCMGPTIDQQICRDIFSASIQSAAILGVDKDWADSLLIIKNQLAPTQISPTNGGIQEWLNDWPSTDPHHRHVSQLFGLFPYDEISMSNTPTLAAAARRTLEMRGDGGTGWSKAWKINFWARLADGDHALVLLKGLLNPVTDLITDMHNGGGTYPNLFDAHPPFQIDGNFGGTSGIAEMLLQSQGTPSVIQFLPALPSDKDWAVGNIKGLVARNNFIIDMSWAENKLSSAVIHARQEGICRLQLPNGKIILNQNGQPLQNITMDGNIASFFAQKGKSYFINPK